MKDVHKRLAHIDAGFVLDAATGRGEFINTIKTNFRSYTQIIGIDNSEKSVNYAQKLFPDNDIEIYRMNLEQLSFDDEQFDTVTISNSLHHLEHRDKVFTELLRVLKKGGTLIIAEMYKDGAQSEAQQTHILLHHWIAMVDRRLGVYHRESYNKEEIIDFARSLPITEPEIMDYYVPVDNPKANTTCESLQRNCTETLKRLESTEGAEELAARGRELLDRLAEVGCASASRLLVIGTKK